MASISTKTGDMGTTSLLFNKRVSKADPRVRFYGALDEAAAHITAARALVTPEDAAVLRTVQERLVYATAEAATAPEHIEALKSSYEVVSETDSQFLEKLIHELEAKGMKFKGWVEDLQPGYVNLELARTVIRRAETQAVELMEKEELRAELLAYLNRLSDFLWIFARKPGIDESS